MDLQNNLIESKKNGRQKGGWKASATSIAAHALLVAGVIYAGTTASHKVNAEDKPIRAFITQGAAPPPPPPPPPPPAKSASLSKPKQVVTPKVQVQQPTFVQPREIPKEVPKVQPIPTKDAIVDLRPNPDPEPAVDAGGGTEDAGAASDAGVPGGVAGGVAGGVVGGEVGGTVGGEIGGVKGGEIGGVLGGKVGGTGTGKEGEGSGGVEAPVAKAPEPEPPSGPLRVGGDVKAPVITNRADPDYTNAARTARVAGVVIVEAIIDENGNVDNVKVIKGLPMGLSESAATAVRKWKFRPGTLNGRPVATIFNLTVNFKMD